MLYLENAYIHIGERACRWILFEVVRMELKPSPCRQSLCNVAVSCHLPTAFTRRSDYCRIIWTSPKKYHRLNGFQININKNITLKVSQLFASYTTKHNDRKELTKFHNVSNLTLLLRNNNKIFWNQILIRPVLQVSTFIDNLCIVSQLSQREKNLLICIELFVKETD